jgi:hypothetical protein
MCNCANRCECECEYEGAIAISRLRHALPPARGPVPSSFLYSIPPPLMVTVQKVTVGRSGLVSRPTMAADRIGSGNQGNQLLKSG